MTETPLPGWVDAARAVGCTHYLGADHRWCGAMPTRAYLQGPRCWDHTPARMAGRPEPDPSYTPKEARRG